MLQTKHKWFAKPDTFTINELTTDLPAEDPFKKNRTIVHKKKTDYTPKLPPNQIDRMDKGVKMSGP
jgi:hypothetical protein